MPLIKPNNQHHHAQRYKHHIIGIKMQKCGFHLMNLIILITNLPTPNNIVNGSIFKTFDKFGYINLYIKAAPLPRRISCRVIYLTLDLLI